MEIYPEILPDYGYLFYPRFITDKIGPTDGQVTQRRRLTSNTLYTVELQYSNISAEDEQTLIKFFENMYGDYTAFVFYDFISRDYTSESIGTGTGSLQLFTLSCRDATDITIYLNGSPTTAYTLDNRTGTNGQDQITFNSAPGDGVVITADYSSKKYLDYCFFDKGSIKSANKSFTRHSISKFTINQENS